MESVVTVVVTQKQGLSCCFPCEIAINGGRRVVNLCLYITKRGGCEYSQALNPVFRVTTEVTTVLQNKEVFVCDSSKEMGKKPGATPVVMFCESFMMWLRPDRRTTKKHHNQFKEITK